MNLKQRFALSRFISGEKKPQDSYTLSHRRIFILPTLRGLGFILLIFILLLIAFVYNNNLAYLLAFLLASIFFISILHSYKSLAGLQVSQGQTQAAFLGEAVAFDIVIDNPQAEPRPGLKIKLESETAFSLQAEEKKRLTLYAVTRQRGWQNIDAVTVYSYYPLGFFRAWSPLRFNTKALVYPRPSSEEIAFPESADESNQTQGESLLNKSAQDEFYGLKEYQAGDSIRQIHWKAYAKGQGLFTKQYSGQQQTELWLDYQQTPGHTLEHRLSQLSRWLIDAEKAGVKYGLSLPGVNIVPGHGLSHYHKCLEAVALF